MELDAIVYMKTMSPHVGDGAGFNPLALLRRDVASSTPALIRIE